jgi:trigger factor
MSWQSFLGGEQGESEAAADIDIGSSNIFPEIKEALIDMQPGEAKAVDIDTSQSQERQPDDPLEGREVHIEFTLNTITQKQLPELDDEFARDLDHENYDQFYATIWNEMVEEEKNEQYRRQQAEIRQQVVEKVEIEVPESLIERYVQESLTNIHAQLEQEGRTAEEAEIDLEEMPNQLHQSFVADTKSTWFFDEVSAREEIEMTDDELDIEIRRIAERQDRDPQKYASLLKASNRVEEFRRQMRDEKIYRYLIEHASEKESLIITPS